MCLKFVDAAGLPSKSKNCRTGVGKRVRTGECRWCKEVAAVDLL